MFKLHIIQAYFEGGCACAGSTPNSAVALSHLQWQTCPSSCSRCPQTRWPTPGSMSSATHTWAERTPPLTWPAALLRTETQSTSTYLELVLKSNELLWRCLPIGLLKSLSSSNTLLCQRGWTAYDCS